MTGPGPASQPSHGAGGASVGELVREVAQDLTTLVRQEIALAKAETKEEITKAGKAGGAFGGAGLAGWITVVFLSLALMFALGAVMPLGWAALIVAVIWAAVGAGLALYGRSRIRQVNPVPQRTVETVKEDVAWIQNRNA
jgi:hypothetical protein